jgi:N-acetylglucosamine-6-phosphate deacetylase
MLKKRIRSKKRIIVFYAVILVFVQNSIFASSQDTIRGFLYQDNSPVMICVEDGKISDIVRLRDIPDDFPKVYISPGFIDNQINGYKGISFGSGKVLKADDIKYVVREIWKEGFTTFLPTLTSNGHDVLIRNIRLLAQVMNDSCILGSIPGIHLEGPYISPEEGFRGAHPLEYIRTPDWKEFMEYYIASGQKILQITLAPEITGALDFINKCREKGIVVALGHHNASAELIQAAVDRGAQIVTHLGNGTANTINRHLNPFWPQLADDRLLISMICDGVHLLPEEIMVFYKVKGADKIVITSDVTYFAGLPVGNYTTPEGVKIKLTPEGKIWNPEKNILHGSAISIRKGIGHVMCVTGCSLAEAVKMSSTNVANLYGLHDRGVIQPGKRADLTLFTSGERGIIQIEKTYVRGQLVYDADSEKNKLRFK